MNNLPVTIATLLNQIGRSAMRKVGAGPIVYNHPKEFRDEECRSAHSSVVTPDGLIQADVCVFFSVAGIPGQNWKLHVTYEPSDVYTVRLWRNSSGTRPAGEVLRSITSVYGEMLSTLIPEILQEELEQQLTVHV